MENDGGSEDGGVRARVKVTVMPRARVGTGATDDGKDEGGML